METILGIDPGSRITGYGVIQSDGQRYRYVASGCISIQAITVTERLQQIYSSIHKLIEFYKPHQAAIEQVFLHRNASSALKLGQARCAAIVAIASRNIRLAEYAPREIKQAIVGYGGAEKIQIQQMIKRLLHLNELPQADAADALAIALCHANSSKVLAARAQLSEQIEHKIVLE